MPEQIKVIGLPTIEEFVKEFSPGAIIKNSDDNELFVKSLWPFCRHELWKINIDAYNKYGHHLIGAKIINNLWGIKHKDYNNYELLVPIVRNTHKEFLLNIAFRLNEGNVNLKTEKPTDAFLALFKIFIPLPYPGEVCSDYYSLYANWYSFIHNEKEVNSEIYKQFRMWSAFLVLPTAINHVESDLSYLCKRINFALRRTCDKAPIIAIEDSVRIERDDEHKSGSEDTDYEYSIHGKRLEINVGYYDHRLLDIYMAAEQEDSPRHRFLMYFNVLEYLLEWAIEDKAVRLIKTRLADPRMCVETDDFVRDLISTLKLYSGTESDKSTTRIKLIQLVGRVITDDELSRFIEPIKNDFKSQTDFERGVTVPELIPLKKDLTKTTAEAIYTIRNGIVHHSVNSILPTIKNEIQLSRWVVIIREIAQRAVIAFQN